MSSADYAVVYIEILVLCAGYSLIILRRTRADLGSSLAAIVFQWFLRTFTVMLFLDGFTQLQYNDIIHPPLITVAFGYAGYQFLLCTLAVLWMLFAEIEITGRVPSRRVIIAGGVVPLTFMAVLAFATPWTGWLFTFDERGHFVRGPYFVVLMVFAYVYFVITACHAFYRYRREALRARKRRMLLVASFIVAPTIGAAFQILVGEAPFVPPSVCIAFIYIYVNIQSDLVYVDPLTGLNNRKSMEKFLDDIRARVSAQSPYYFFLIDADSFKSVNDNYGHVEGDRALKTIADALRKTGGTFGGFLARYGGDEFVAILNGEQADEPERFVQALKENLAALHEKTDAPYALGVSAGYTRWERTETKLAELTAEADRMLYEKKKEAHGEAGARRTLLQRRQ